MRRPPSRQPATGRRRTAAPMVALVALAVLATACGSPDRPTLLDQAGSTTATTGRTEALPSGAQTEDGAQPAGMVDDDGSTVSVPDPTSTTAGPASVPEETLPPPPGVAAVLSPTGVLVRVTGQAAGGYVVESPCGNPAVIAWGQPVGPVRVVLDPGHGGDEEGAVGATGLTEAELNLALGRRTAAELTRRSIPVVLTRNGDYRIPIRQRAALADALGPEALVSIHHNTPASAPSPTPGTEVYVQSGSAVSRRLGGVLHQSVVEALATFDIEWTARSDAGVLTVLDEAGDDAYGINRYPVTPSALVELAYLGNPKEEALLATDDYLEAASRALADGIERFLDSEEAGSGFVDIPRSATPQSTTGGARGCVDPPLQ